MRTTLDIDSDVLQVAKEIAKAEKRTAGYVLSALARKALLTKEQRRPKTRNGIPLIPVSTYPITVDHIQQIMDREGI